MNSTPITLETAAKVLIRCFWMGIAFQLFILIWITPAGDWAYQMHRNLFNISRHEFDLIMYCFMGLVKLIAVTGFLFPYLAIRLVLRKK